MFDFISESFKSKNNLNGRDFLGGFWRPLKTSALALVIKTAQGRREALGFWLFYFPCWNGVHVCCVCYGVLFMCEMVIHSHLSDMSLDVLCLVVPHGVVKPCQPDPEPIKAVIWAVHREHRGPGVSLGHPPVPLEHDYLGPDLIIDTLPLVENLLDVILKNWDVIECFESYFETQRVLRCQIRHVEVIHLADELTIGQYLPRILACNF